MHALTDFIMILLLLIRIKRLNILMMVTGILFHIFSILMEFIPRLVFPGLESLKKEPEHCQSIAINKARLSCSCIIMTVITLHSINSTFISLRLRYKTKDGYKYDVPDYYVDQDHKFFDGNLDTVNKVYNFNIPLIMSAVIWMMQQGL